MALAAALLLGAAVAQTSLTARPAGEEFGLALRDHVVRINTTWTDGSAQTGFGFIVGRNAQGAYIATANHVLRGALPGEQAETITVTYYRHQGEQFPGTLLSTHDAGRDLAVLRAPLPDGFELSADLLRRAAGAPERGAPVWYVGRTARWYVPAQPGTVNSVDLDERINVEGLNVQVGTSGAPLVGDDGITGMIISDEPGVTYAIGIGFIERAFRFWAHPWELTATAPAIARRPDDEPETPPATPPPGAEPPTATEPPDQPPSPAVATPPAPAAARMAQADREHALGAVRALLRDLAVIPAWAEPSGGAPPLPPGLLGIANGQAELTEAGDLQASGTVYIGAVLLGDVVARAELRPDLVPVDLAIGPVIDTAGLDPECRVRPGGHTVGLIWDDARQTVSGFSARFDGVALDCGDVSLAARSVTVDVGLDRHGQAWTQSTEAEISGLTIRPGGAMADSQVGSLKVRFALQDVDLAGWLAAARTGLADNWLRWLAPLVLWQGDQWAEGVELSVESSDLALVVGSPDGMPIGGDTAGLELSTRPNASLSYRHAGARASGIFGFLPASLSVLTRARGELSVTEIIEAVGNERKLDGLLDRRGPLTVTIEAATASARAQATGAIISHRAGARQAVFDVGFDDPAAFIAETLLNLPGSGFDGPDARQAVAYMVDALSAGRPLAPDGTRHFDVSLDLVLGDVMVNDHDETALSQLMTEACEIYACLGP